MGQNSSIAGTKNNEPAPALRASWARKKRTYRSRRRRKEKVLAVPVGPAFAKALLAAGMISPEATEDRIALAKEVAAILDWWTRIWLRLPVDQNLRLPIDHST